MKAGSLLPIHSIYFTYFPLPHLPPFPFPFLARNSDTFFSVSAEYVKFLIMCMILLSFTGQSSMDRCRIATLLWYECERI